MGATPAATPVAYHAGLVAELKAEHAALLGIYGAIGQAMQQDRWDDVSKILGRLRTILTAHLLKESVQLYCYLQRQLIDDTDAQALFRAFKVEMRNIGAAAFDFVDRHAAPGTLAGPTARAAFQQEYASIGQVLADRIRREEAQLYPMYRPRAGVGS